MCQSLFFFVRVVSNVFSTLDETTHERLANALCCDAAGGNNTTPGSSKIETSLKSSSSSSSSSSSVRVSQNVTRDIKSMPLAKIFFFWNFDTLNIYIYFCFFF